MSDIPAEFTEEWLERLDGRTKMARAVRERLHALHSDLGGEAALSYQERSLCRRIVWLEALIEKQELNLARGEDVDQGRLAQTINTLVGLLKAIGLQRRVKEAPSLGEYLRQRQGAV